LIAADLGGTLVKADEAIMAAVQCLRKIHAQDPRYLLDSFAGLCWIVR
jgi:ribonucleotide monophosphatase NagD (HAD superfamily)